MKLHWYQSLTPVYDEHGTHKFDAVNNHGFSRQGDVLDHKNLREEIMRLSTASDRNAILPTDQAGVSILSYLGYFDKGEE